MPRLAGVSEFCNIFDLISEDKMLITAAADGRVNTMTASWGGAGFLWGQPVAVCFIRPGRFTERFVEASQALSLSFFGGERRRALAICGSMSGRDGDKFEAAGLSPAYRAGVPYIAEAHTVLICRRLYSAPFERSRFVDDGQICTRFYPDDDYHIMHICAIEAVLTDRPEL